MEKFYMKAMKRKRKTKATQKGALEQWGSSG